MGLAVRAILAVSFGVASAAHSVCVSAGEITAQEVCDISAKHESELVLIDSKDQINRLTGWNHASPLKAEFKGMFQYLLHSGDVSAYEVDETAWRANPHCSDRPTFNTTLAVKLNDWTRQHVNGLEHLFSEPSPSFASVDRLEIVMRLAPAKTNIPSMAELRATYPFLSTAELHKLDDGNAAFGITLFAHGALDQTTRSLNADALVTLQAKHFKGESSGRWLKISLPISRFNFFFEQDYQREQADLSDAKNINIAGIRITAETHQGQQLRNILGDLWSEKIQESFKEVSAEFSRVALVLDSTDQAIRNSSK